MLPFFPAIFVFLWSTGFVGARYAMPHAEPFTFLALRFALALVILVPLAGFALRGARGVTARAARPCRLRGSLIHGLYLGGVFFAVRHGLPAGVTALVAGLQPLLTALLAAGLVGERVTVRHWAGLAVGLLGVGLVVAPKLGQASGFTAGQLAPALVAVAAISLGTVWQKRFVGTLDLRSGHGGAVCGRRAADLHGGLRLRDHARGLDGRARARASLADAGAFDRGDLPPALSHPRGRRVARRLADVSRAGRHGLMAFVLFGEALTPVQLVGMALAAGGVAAATGALKLGRRREA